MRFNPRFYLFVLLIFLHFAVLRIKPRAQHKLGEHSTLSYALGPNPGLEILIYPKRRKGKRGDEADPLTTVATQPHSWGQSSPGPVRSSSPHQAHEASACFKWSELAIMKPMEGSGSLVPPALPPSLLTFPMPEIPSWLGSDSARAAVHPAPGPEHAGDPDAKHMVTWPTASCPRSPPLPGPVGSSEPYIQAPGSSFCHLQAEVVCQPHSPNPPQACEGHGPSAPGGN